MHLMTFSEKESEMKRISATIILFLLAFGVFAHGGGESALGSDEPVTLTFASWSIQEKVLRITSMS